MPAVLVEIVIDKDTGVPKTVVDKAVAEKKRGKYDEVWCVFDIDEHPQIAEARQKADANHVHVAISNPCFELWILLHFEYRSAHISRQDARRKCEEFIDSYDKHIPCDAVLPLVETALANVKRLALWQESRTKAGENPSTDVYKLVERLLSGSQKERLKQIEDFA